MVRKESEPRGRADARFDISSLVDYTSAVPKEPGDARMKEEAPPRPPAGFMAWVQADRDSRTEWTITRGEARAVIERLFANVADAERQRDSLDLQVRAMDHARIKDNQYLIGQRDEAYRLLKTATDTIRFPCSDCRPFIEQARQILAAVDWNEKGLQR